MPRLTRTLADVDPETGEVRPRLRVDFTSKADTQFFTMLLVPLDERWFHIKHTKDFHVFGKLCELAEYGTGRILLSGTQRLEVMQACGMTSSHLSNSLRRLAAAGVIATRRGEATLNPHVAWKGTGVSRRAALEKLRQSIKSTDHTS